MAIFKVGLVVSDIKGTSGGTVFSANKGGNYTRRYKKPTNRNSEKQHAVRSAFGSMTGAWRTLTELQRSSWNEGAVHFPMMNKLGESKILSGQQLFNKLNNNLIQLGQSILETCPIPQSFPEVSVVVDSNVTTGNVLTVTISYDGATEVPADFSCIVNATASMSAGINSPQKGLFKKIAVFEAAEDTGSSSIVAAYNGEFGALITGDTIFVGVTIVNTISGEASTMITAKSTRVAV